MEKQFYNRLIMKKVSELGDEIKRNKSYIEFLKRDIKEISKRIKIEIKNIK